MHEDHLKTIHLGIYGNKSEQILRNLRAWCLDRRGYNICASTFVERMFKYFDIIRQPDGELALDVFGSAYQVSRTPLYNRTNRALKSDTDIRRWLAHCVKGMVKHTMFGWGYKSVAEAAAATCDKWNRNNDETVVLKFPTANKYDNLPSMTVSETYALYDSLCGRKIKDPALNDIIVGTPFDPVRTEIEQYKLETSERLRRELTDALDTIAAWEDSEYKRVSAEVETRRQNARKSYENALMNLDSEIESILNRAT